MDWSPVTGFISTTVLIFSTAVLLYLYLTRKYDYWKRTNIPFMKPKFPFGTIEELFRLQIHQTKFLEKIYHQFPKEKYIGIFELSQPILLVRDLDLAQNILVKDFSHFVDRSKTPNVPHNWIHKILANSEGDYWKMLRTKCFSPVFSATKMRSMFDRMEGLCTMLTTCMDTLVAEEVPIDVYNLLCRFSTDASAACSVGLNINTMENKNTEFYQYVQAFFNPPRGSLMKRYLVQTWPTLLNVFKMYKTVPKLQEFFRNVVTDIVEERKTSKSTNLDFMDLLLSFKRNGGLKNNNLGENEEDKLKKSVSEASDLSMEEMTAMFVNWFVAGAEISGGIAAEALFCLAHHPQVQEQARLEVDQVLERHGGVVTYEALSEVKYVDMIIYETIRHYRALIPLTRLCTKPYRLPGTDSILNKGVRVIIPQYAIHHDPLLFPEPEKFKPERFGKEHSRHRSAFLPFGDGPRNCVGLRFGMLQTRAALVTLLKDFRFLTGPETPASLEQDPSAIFCKPQHPIKLRVQRR